MKIVRLVPSWWSLLKVVGVALFVWLLLQIDRNVLWQQLRGIELQWALAGIALLLLSDACKVLRWYYLLMTVHKRVTKFYAWETFYIGLFLGMLTPAKLGEFGRLAYLKRSGVRLAMGTAVIALDRVFDVVMIGALSLIAVGYLFGWNWVAFALLAFGVGGVISLMIFKKLWRRISQFEWVRNLELSPQLIIQLSLLTIFSWTLYCLWPLAIMVSLGVWPPVLPFLSAVIMAGIIAMLPVAPSGLGTRDAVLVWLLLPYGIAAEQTLALTFLMFVSLVLTSLPGVWHWVRGVSL